MRTNMSKNETVSLYGFTTLDKIINDLPASVKLGKAVSDEEIYNEDIGFTNGEKIGKECARMNIKADAVINTKDIHPTFLKGFMKGYNENTQS